MPPAAARPSARYRSVIVVLILALVLLGFFALGRLPVDLSPSPGEQRLNIRFSAPGLTAPVIEEKLIRQVESALSAIPGVTAMDTVTMTGGASVDLLINPHRDVVAVQREAMSRLEGISASLPAFLETPVIMLTDASSASVEFTLTSRTLDSLVLRDWVEAEFAKRLRELAGVATVEIQGGTVREIIVMPDQRRLAGYGLSFEDLFLAIRRNPEVQPRFQPSPVKSRSRRESVQTGDLAAVAALPVTLPDGESIRLSEVARLVLIHQPPAVQPEVDGQKVIKVTVHKQAQAALSEVVARVRSHVDWMRANRLIPDGIALHDVSGKFDETRPLLRKIGFALLAGFVLILFAVYLFWGIARRTVIFGVIVAASLQGVFVMMALTGTALDVMTLGGLAMGLGLMGGSVLMMYERPLRPASSFGRINPVVVPSILLMAALIPILMDGGDLGVNFRKLVIYFGAAWLLAAWLAAWLVPIFDVRHPRRSAEPWQVPVAHVMAQWRLFYDRLLHLLLHRAALTLTVAAAAIILLTVFFLEQKRETPLLVERPGNDVVLRVLGQDYTRLVTLADEITFSLGQKAELSQVIHTGQASREEISLKLDVDRAQELGVNMVMAGKALAVATSGIPAGNFRDAEHRYNVSMRLPPEDSGSVAKGKILLLGELENRPAVHLRDVASLERVVVPTRLLHHNGMPMIEISIRMNNGQMSEPVKSKILGVIAKINIPSGYQIILGRHGDAPEGYQGLITPGLSIIMIFGVAWLFYRSLPLALTILFPAYATLVFTVVTLSLFGLALSPPAWVGMILLLGLSAGHAAMLTSSIVAQPTSLSLMRRLRQASRQQFRPWLAVVLTGILGMLSVLWINGEISGLHKVITILSISLVFSLLVNLFLTPPLFWLFSRMEQNPELSRL
ncbi:MAG: efflux RND transporter permease subunit [Gammaproteobacteria bacterium]|nr:efflux RND transporter permease subunit [Gammaproteobacteria bacterium]MDH3370872.1 efflux RND transporter permease subunit [Gammaproteobacteria bacterium]MDH3407031.1 efflux RND transporter permease subunit [Gammaproteobacteria bacterium]MDH3562823.1 efflux RND transporter permease subunit [Gammaproteobacteria bacterium]MDH5487052.1 efflux RND transporter permease subunit [Gammaproteobacteria bacterium]